MNASPRWSGRRILGTRQTCPLHQQGLRLAQAVPLPARGLASGRGRHASPVTGLCLQSQVRPHPRASQALLWAYSRCGPQLGPHSVGKGGWRHEEHHMETDPYLGFLRHLPFGSFAWFSLESLYHPTVWVCSHPLWHDTPWCGTYPDSCSPPPYWTCWRAFLVSKGFSLHSHLASDSDAVSIFVHTSRPLLLFLWDGAPGVGLLGQTPFFKWVFLSLMDCAEESQKSW